MLRRGRMLAVGVAGALVAMSAGAAQAAPQDTTSAQTKVQDQGVRKAVKAKRAKPARIIKADGALRNRWIVVLKKGTKKKVRKNLMRLSRRTGAKRLSEYRLTLNGFAGRMSTRTVKRLSRNPRVAFIEADQVVRKAATQANPTWGLDRIDQANLPLDNSYTYQETGAGVRVYVVDSGVRGEHSEFNGRMLQGRDTLDGDNDTSDCNGHGTHVAGTIAGSTYGVAKGASIVPMRVLGCDGRGSGQAFLDAAEWIAVNNPEGTPAVANASLSFGQYFLAVERAVERSISSGVTWVVAAGNEDVDACDVSAGSRVDRAIVVGATDNTDTRAEFSNHGPCVDVYAPGVDIESAWYTGNNDVNTISGTSMAAPHVAGVAALYLEQNPSATPTRAKGVIVNNSTKDVVKDPKGAPNRLLYMGFLNN